MKPQTIFDKVVTHLLAQGKAAMATVPDLRGGLTEGCAYRGKKKGTACAVGCLIPDDLYDPAYEGSDITMLHRRITLKTHYSDVFTPEVADKARRLWKKLDVKNLTLLERLQTVHDCASERPWKRNKENRRELLTQLAAVAQDFKLKTAHLPAFEELTGVSKRAS